MEDELQVEAYKRFWKFYTTEHTDASPLLPYEEFVTDQDYTMGWFYDGMEEDFTKQLLNSINRFSHEIDVIDIWSNHILTNYPESEQFELTYQFLELPFYFCLNQPQSIRDRIIYCATHLCHQANLFRKIEGYKDHFPDDRNINKKELSNRVFYWEIKNILLDNIESIASEGYLKKTYNYRNLAHHRVPPELEYGHTGFIKRIGYQKSSFEYTTFENGVEVKKIKKTKGVAYSFGGTPPLKAKEMVALFKKQHCLLIKTFCSYWEMVLEHQKYSKKIKI